MRRLTTKEGCLVSCMECAEREDCEKYCYKINTAVKKLKRYEDIGLIPNKVKELLERDTAQKPTEMQQHRDFHGNIYKVTGVCPVCGNEVHSQMRFCDNCGKRLSWMTQEKMDEIATYMDDEKREQVHAELAPCAPEDFLKRYLELEPEFAILLRDEFSIEF
nr:hypothetical protein [uncultured Blautia sp.]